MYIVNSKTNAKYYKDFKNISPGETLIIKYKILSDANLIEARIKNLYYNGGLFKTATVEEYYSMNNSVRLTVLTNETFGCEKVNI